VLHNRVCQSPLVKLGSPGFKLWEKKARLLRNDRGYEGWEAISRYFIDLFGAA